MQDNSYLANIPFWNDFNLVAASGENIPTTKLKDWKEVFEVFNSEFFKIKNGDFVFRGQRRSEWKLDPSLARNTETGIITRDMAEKHIISFRKAVRGRLTDKSLFEDEQIYELWAIGQHHGLKTHLLDWTYSPYVALFFAFEQYDKEQEELSDSYRSIYVLNRQLLSNIEVDDAISDDFQEVKIFEPRKDDHGRLVNQAGLFIVSPYGKTIGNALLEQLVEKHPEFEDDPRKLAKYICKILIPNKGRKECLSALRRMNVHHASLFPDLIGAAEYCNLSLNIEDDISVELNIINEDNTIGVPNEVAEKAKNIHQQIIEKASADESAISILPQYPSIDFILTELGFDKNSQPSLAEIRESILESFKKRIPNADNSDEMFLNEVSNNALIALENLRTVDFYNRDSSLATMRIKLKRYFNSYSIEGDIDELCNDLIFIFSKANILMDYYSK